MLSWAPCKENILAPGSNSYIRPCSCIHPCFCMKISNLAKWFFTHFTQEYVLCMFLYPEQKEFKNLNQIFQDIQNIYFLHIHTGQYIYLGEEGVAAIIISSPPSKPWRDKYPPPYPSTLLLIPLYPPPYLSRPPFLSL